MKKSLWSAFGVGAMLVGAQVAYAALTDSQQYTVTVGKNVSIVAPTAAQTKTYTVADLTAAESVSDDTYTFPVQTWHAKGNVKNGVSVQFSMPAFNESTLAVKQDGGLSVALGATTGPATWSPLGPTASSSNYANTVTVLGVTTPNPLSANVSYFDCPRMGCSPQVILWDDDASCRR